VGCARSAVGLPFASTKVLTHALRHPPGSGQCLDFIGRRGQKVQHRGFPKEWFIGS
jgi:hypothetical protein